MASLTRQTLITSAHFRTVRHSGVSRLPADAGVDKAAVSTDFESSSRSWIASLVSDRSFDSPSSPLLRLSEVVLDRGFVGGCGTKVRYSTETISW